MFDLKGQDGHDLSIHYMLLMYCLQWSLTRSKTFLDSFCFLPELWLIWTGKNKLQLCRWPCKSGPMNYSITEFIMAFMACIPNERLSTNRGVEEKQAHALCALLYLSLLSAVSQANNAERYLKFFAIINFDKKKDKNWKAMCSIHLFTNCGEHRRLCGPPYHCVQLWLGCQWGIWGAGWGRQEGLGAVIKLPLFPPGSLQGSNSALIG